MFGSLRVEVWAPRGTGGRARVPFRDSPSLLRGSGALGALQAQLWQKLGDLPLDAARWQRLHATAAPFRAQADLRVQANYFWLLRRRYYKRQARRRALQRIVPLLRRNVVRKRRNSASYAATLQQLRAAVSARTGIAKARQQLEDILGGVFAAPPALEIGPIAEDEQGEHSDEEDDAPRPTPAAVLALPAAGMRENLALIKRKLRAGEAVRASHAALPPPRPTAERSRLSNKLDWSAVPGRVSCWLKPSSAPPKQTAVRVRPKSGHTLRQSLSAHRGSTSALPDISTTEICAVYHASLLPKMAAVLGHAPPALHPGVARFDARLLRVDGQPFPAVSLAEERQQQRLQAVIDGMYGMILNE